MENKKPSQPAGSQRDEQREKSRAKYQKRAEGVEVMEAAPDKGIFDDENPETVSRWKYPDTGEWSPQRNNDEFVAAMKDWRNHGLLAFTLNLQGGNPRGYGGQAGLINSAFDPEGNLKAPFLERLEKILREADRLGMVVILGLFYFGQDQNMKDEQAILNAVDKALGWLHPSNYEIKDFLWVPRTFSRGSII